MRPFESCLRLRWHIDQLRVLRRQRASQAEAARAYKTLLTKLSGKSEGGGLRVPFCPCLLDGVCLSWWGSCATGASRGQPRKKVQVRKSGTTVAANVPHNNFN